MVSRMVCNVAEVASFLRSWTARFGASQHSCQKMVRQIGMGCDDVLAGIRCCPLPSNGRLFLLGVPHNLERNHSGMGMADHRADMAARVDRRHRLSISMKLRNGR